MRPTKLSLAPLRSAGAACYAQGRAEPKVSLPFRVTGCKACLSALGIGRACPCGPTNGERDDASEKVAASRVSAAEKATASRVGNGFPHMARDYADAANELYMVADARPKIHGHMPLSSPLYFLYSHAAELALKAFLTANNVPINELTDHKVRHNLPKLYDQSRNLGFIELGARDRFEIGNVVSLLHSENKDHGFRYFSLESTSGLIWRRSAKLSRTTAGRRATCPPSTAPGVAVKTIMTLGKGEDEAQAKPVQKNQTKATEP